MSMLDQILSLRELVKNPFLLALSLDVLPRMVDPDQKDLATAKVTRVTLYDQFMEQWLERGKKRLVDKDLSGRERKAFESLSDEGFCTECREDDKQLLRDAYPLTWSGNQYRFIHRSILEYGLARAVFEPRNGGIGVRKAEEPTVVAKRRDSVNSACSFEIEGALEDIAVSTIQGPNPGSPLVWRDFVGEPSILQFLEERVQHELVFKNQLLMYVLSSKGDKQWRIATASAITILVRAGIRFNGADLKGVRIPGVDLSGSQFDSAQLQGAD
ncbi:hypothetical protein BG000_005263 [Podila horticola]|nr:hypothetical protein BG000_005263 [Podila horticola]